MTSAEVDPLDRCCGHHDDWSTLSEHLARGFPEVDSGDVVVQLGRAKSAVEHFGLSQADQIEVAELITRQQLMIISGRTTDVARLDPEQHRRSGRECEADGEL